jgi:hypothetical protein
VGRLLRARLQLREIRYFDIEGKVTGLVSKAMTSPDGKIRIPLNESKGDSGQVDQIEEYLRAYKGEGIQHIALGSRDLYQTVDTLTANGVPLQDVIETYYDLVDSACRPRRAVDELRKRRILIDGAPSEGRACCCRSSARTPLGRSSSSSSSARATRASARATSRPCSRASSSTRSAAASSRRPPRNEDPRRGRL